MPKTNYTKRRRNNRSPKGAQLSDYIDASMIIQLSEKGTYTVKVVNDEGNSIPPSNIPNLPLLLVMYNHYREHNHLPLDTIVPCKSEAETAFEVTTNIHSLRDFVTKFQKDAAQCQLGYYLVIEE
jgi:hypothetical protein